MKLKLVSVGKMKAVGGFQDMDLFYRKRIKPFASLEISELKEKDSIKQETDLIKKHIPENSYVIALREDGEKLNSIKFSKILKDMKESGKVGVFVIGGAYGFENVGEKISISIAPWTLPHQLARVVLVEQIYRGLSILSGSKYHHG